MQFRSAHLLLSNESKVKHSIVKGNVGIEPEKFEKAIPVISCPHAIFARNLLYIANYVAERVRDSSVPSAKGGVAAECRCQRHGRKFPV